jgi:hypothetical protein
MNGAAQPTPGTLSACPFVPCFVITPGAHPLLFSARKRKVGPAGLELGEFFFQNFL